MQWRAAVWWLVCMAATIMMVEGLKALGGFRFGGIRFRV